MTLRRAAAGALAILVLAGCSGGGPAPARPPAPPEPRGTGYFVGTGPDGVGASLDLFADDPIVREIDAALAARGGPRGDRPAVGVASIVNDGRFGILTPRFIADLSTGGALPLRSAADALSGAAGPAARRARARLGDAPRRVPGGGAVTAYVVLEGAAPEAVGSVRMVLARGGSVTLTARRR